MNNPSPEKQAKSHLAQKTCEPCRGEVPPLGAKDQERILAQLQTDWMVENNHHLNRTFTFPDFVTALAFVNKVGAVAEEQGHHPDLSLTWGKVTVQIWTHKINGLTESDFILAAKIDQLSSH